MDILYVLQNYPASFEQNIMFQGYDPERIGLLPEWLSAFISMHNKHKHILGAKFSIGEEVIYKNNIRKVLAINIRGENTVEYAISDCYSLVYEKELGVLN